MGRLRVTDVWIAAILSVAIIVAATYLGGRDD